MTRATTHFEQFGVDQNTIRRVLDKSLARGGDFGEIYLEHTVTHWLGVEDGAVDRATTEVELGAGIRVLDGDATGYAYCEDLTEQALTAAATTAAAIADSTPRSRTAPPLPVETRDHYPAETPWSLVGIERKLPLVERVDRVARNRDQRIVKVSVSLADQEQHVLVANSEGLRAGDTRPMTTMYARCVAQHRGRTESGYEIASRRDDLRFYTDEELDRIARAAADHTVVLFEAVPAPVGEIPVVLGPAYGGIMLHEAMGHGFEADFNRKGISIYTGRIGDRIAPRGVTIVDDATLPHRRGSLNIDDEGTPGQRTVLVEDGVLRSYMHDRISAAHYGVPGTGNGRRESFRHPPIPRMRNTYMEPGILSPDEIIASIDKGLYAEDFSNGQVMIGAGDFTFYLTRGRLIEHGKLTAVVKDANLIGNGPRVLEHVQMVGDDLAFEASGGTCGKDGQGVPVCDGTPTLRVGAISVGGST